MLPLCHVFVLTPSIAHWYHLLSLVSLCWLCGDFTHTNTQYEKTLCFFSFFSLLLTVIKKFKKSKNSFLGYILARWIYLFEVWNSFMYMVYTGTDIPSKACVYNHVFSIIFPQLNSGNFWEGKKKTNWKPKWEASIEVSDNSFSSVFP